MRQQRLYLAITATTVAAGLALAAGSLAGVPHSALPTRTPICMAPRKATAVSGGYGIVHFANSCSKSVQPALQGAIAKLHSFEAEPKDFTSVAAADPGCAMAWWGAAMSARGNPLGDTVDDKTLKLGKAYVDRARRTRHSDPDEGRLIDAMGVYYSPYRDQMSRARAYAAKMAEAHAAAPADPDVAALYGLALIEGVDLNDKSYRLQKKAGAVLEGVMAAYPDHPGAPHYLIHAYDYTALAPSAVHAAEVYPSIATSSVHANHMPAHIWSMLGRWDQSIAANRTSEFLADRKSRHDEVRGDIVYEHAFDFIAYARLQKGQYHHVRADLDALKTPTPVVTARYALERGDWLEATKLSVPQDDAFEQALTRFARAYGAARLGEIAAATDEINALKALRQPVASSAGEYWGVFVDIYADAAQAWLLKAKGRTEAALALMHRAATRDDSHEKHIYLENKILPMREALADMELAVGQPRQAIEDYTSSLRLAPNRLRSFRGAMTAAKAAGETAQSEEWSAKLAELTKDGDRYQ